MVSKYAFHTQLVGSVYIRSDIGGGERRLETVSRECFKAGFMLLRVGCEWTGRALALGKLTVNLKADVNDVVAMVPGLDEAVNLINDTVIANLQV